MTDRELLELAAKAAGVEYEIDADYEFWLHTSIGGHSGAWNPLTDDGDALRLAVKLHIDFYINHAVRVDYHIKGAPTVPLYEALEPDPHAATRRAIVRAAAAIGAQHSQAAGGEG